MSASWSNIIPQRRRHERVDVDLLEPGDVVVRGHDLGTLVVAARPVWNADRRLWRVDYAGGRFQWYADGDTVEIAEPDEDVDDELVVVVHVGYGKALRRVDDLIDDADAAAQERGHR